MSNNPKLQDMGEHAKQLLGLIQECKPDANLELLAGKLKQWRIELDKVPTKTDFIIHDDRTVTHVQTGLMWKRECELQKYSYQEAIYEFGNNYYEFAGYNDWRLPTIDELKTLLLPESPHIDTEAFPDNPSFVLSGSPVAENENSAWGVYFDDGYSGYRHRYNGNDGVRLVRGGQ